MTTEEQFYIVPTETHNELVKKAYQHRGFDASECEAAAKFSAYATTHGIRTAHNALKALHLDDLFGSKAGGCKPSAQILKKENRFESSEVWDCQFKLGQATAYEAMDRCIELADKYGIGQVSVDHAFHYLWGGGYVMDAAKRGYIAYTNCTASITEVVPFMGSVPTLGTNPIPGVFLQPMLLGSPLLLIGQHQSSPWAGFNNLKEKGNRFLRGLRLTKMAMKLSILTRYRHSSLLAHTRDMGYRSSMK